MAYNIPDLTPQTLDTSQFLQNKQTAQNDGLELLKKKYEVASEQDKQEVRSVGLAALQAEGLIDQPEALENFLNTRIKNIDARVAQGMATDSNDTRLLLDTYKKDTSPDKAQFKHLLNAYKQTAIAVGAIDSPQVSAGGDTGVLINRLINEGSAENVSDALRLIKGGAGAEGRLGAEIALGNEASYQSKSGTDRATIESARRIATETKLGTDYPDTYAGAGMMDKITGDLNEIYNQLDEKGAIVSTENSALGNVAASARGSTVGQYVGKRFGTESQSLRNRLAMQRPALINAIRQATGMSAKAMDSNTELQFYLKMATDPTADVQANRAALNYLSDTYGLAGVQMQKFGNNSSPKSFNSVEEAESANLPAGTIITINGKRAIVENAN